MTNALPRLATGWFQPVPAERLSLLRVAVGGYALLYLLLRFANLNSYGSFEDSQFDPVGPVALLSEPFDQGVVTLLLFATVGTGIAFVAGWRFALIAAGVTAFDDTVDATPAVYLAETKLLCPKAPAVNIAVISRRKKDFIEPHFGGRTIPFRGTPGFAFASLAIAFSDKVAGNLYRFSYLNRLRFEGLFQNLPGIAYS